MRVIPLGSLIRSIRSPETEAIGSNFWERSKSLKLIKVWNWNKSSAACKNGEDIETRETS